MYQKQKVIKSLFDVNSLCEYFKLFVLYKTLDSNLELKLESIGRGVVSNFKHSHVNRKY